MVRSRKRFNALRDFTVEGAVAELDRQAQGRKDRASGTVEPAGVRSPARNGSIDSIRSPASARSPQLGHVPEHGAFAIGDDEDEEGEGEHNAHAEFSAPLSASTSVVVDDAVPMQSRSMSEKARGKQPVGQGSFSRSTSRNTSTTSLSSLITPQTASTIAAQQHFIPTTLWVSFDASSSSSCPTTKVCLLTRRAPSQLETWLPRLPLHTILSIVNRDGLRDEEAGARAKDAAALPSTTTTESGNRGAQAKLKAGNPAALPSSTAEQSGDAGVEAQDAGRVASPLRKHRF